MMPRVGVVILAAGESSRLGAPKQLVKFRGQSLIKGAVTAALESICRPTIVVLGANANKIRAEISRDIRIVENPQWTEGVASSIRAGVAAIEAEVDAIILMLADQPLVDSKILNRFVDNANAGLVAAEYGGTIGVPALFGREFFEQLRQLHGAQGAKKILLENERRVMRIVCPEAAMDIDTAQELQRLQSFE